MYSKASANVGALLFMLIIMMGKLWSKKEKYVKKA